MVELDSNCACIPELEEEDLIVNHSSRFEFHSLQQVAPLSLKETYVEGYQELTKVSLMGSSKVLKSVLPGILLPRLCELTVISPSISLGIGVSVWSSNIYKYAALFTYSTSFRHYLHLGSPPP